MDNSAIGDRMKAYESVSKGRLMKRVPVAIRCDGRAFHSFTRGLKRPFDPILNQTMQDTMKYMCENIQGCVLGYTQSDEITLILIDYQTLTTSAWFDYEIQKLCSISASLATLGFNTAYSRNIQSIQLPLTLEYMSDEKQKGFLKYYHTYHDKVNKAMFDARCFNIPREEVTNLVYWRQLDATRNSIQACGQAYFSHKELQNKSCNEIQDMLLTQKDINWNNLMAWEKRGSCCIKNDEGQWIIDNNIPIFKGDGRDYIEGVINL